MSKILVKGYSEEGRQGNNKLIRKGIRDSLEKEWLKRIGSKRGRRKDDLKMCWKSKGVEGILKIVEKWLSLKGGAEIGDSGHVIVEHVLTTPNFHPLFETDFHC